MDCSEFHTIASLVLEGESHPEAHRHLASCPRCRVLVDELSALERAARTLPFREPRASLWARVEAAAASEGLWSQPAWPQWAGPFAAVFPLRPAVAAVLGLTLLLAGALVGGPTLELPISPAASASRFEVAQGELVQEPSYATRYQIHLNQLEDRVLAEAVPVDAELRELAARPLHDVNRCIEQTQLRLNDYPDDTQAREELRRLYQQKATVLQAMANPAWMEAAGR